MDFIFDDSCLVLKYEESFFERYGQDDEPADADFYESICDCARCWPQ